MTTATAAVSGRWSDLLFVPDQETVRAARCAGHQAVDRQVVPGFEPVVISSSGVPGEVAASSSPGLVRRPLCHFR